MVKEELAARTLEMGKEFGIENNTRSVKEIGFLSKLFSTASEFSSNLSNSMGLYRQSSRKTRKAQNALEKEIKKHQDKVIEWANSNGMSLMDAYKMMINPKTGNLVGRYSDDFYEKVKQARKDNNVQWIKENLEAKEDTIKFNEWNLVNLNV